MHAKMKLYIWDDVLCDYTCGIAFAIAPSVEDARKQVCKLIPYWTDDFSAAPKEYRVDRRVARIKC